MEVYSPLSNIRTSIHVRILDSTSQERGSFKKWHVLTINYSQLGSKLLFHHENQARSLITHVDFGFVTCLGWENTTSVFPTSATDGSLYKSTQDQELQRPSKWSKGKGRASKWEQETNRDLHLKLTGLLNIFSRKSIFVKSSFHPIFSPFEGRVQI